VIKAGWSPADAPTVRRVLTAYRERVRQRPDSEHDQALLRTGVVSLLLLNTAWIASRDSRVGVWPWAIAIFSTVFSVLLLAQILRQPAASPRRRILGAVHDNVAATLWLYSCGPIGALALFVYPFVTVGNGFRFGVRYLACSGLLGALGIGVLVVAAPGWTSYGTIGVGVLLSHVLVTVYTGVLLRRLHQTQARLAELASCDALTGLPNRRLFLDRLSELTVAPGRPHLACLYLDLDGFKAVNDRCGHNVGDEVLNLVADAVRSCIRSSDTLARLGGDEFTVIVDVASLDEARLVAGRIIRAVGAITSVGGHDVDVSVSVGVSFVPADSPEQPVTAEALLKAADDAMYVAKHSGGGRCRFASPVAVAS
jgi:diguanylate cyclase (GGDEF)-like protein